MKKIRICFLGVLLAMTLFALTACGRDDNAQNNSNAGGSNTTTQSTSGGDTGNSTTESSGTGSGTTGNGTSGNNSSTQESSTGVIDGMIDDVEQGVNDMLGDDTETTNGADESSN